MLKNPRSRYCIALVTAPNIKTARKLASQILKAKTAACVNIIPGLESHYWWQGKLDKGAELLLLIKTTRKRLAELERVVLANHPYDTPEFIVGPIQSGNRRYLDWIDASVR